jgi:hypothetical protein
MKPNMPNNQINGGNQMPSNNGQIQIQMNSAHMNSAQANSGPQQMNVVPEQMNKSANNITDDFNNLVVAKEGSAIEKSNDSSVISSVSSAELSSSDSSGSGSGSGSDNGNDDNGNHGHDGNINEVKKSVQQKNNGTKKVEEFKVVQNDTVQAPVKTWNQFFINMGVLFALFFLFSSKQVESGLNAIPYLKDIPFIEQINLLSRGLLMVVIYVVLDKFVL